MGLSRVEINQVRNIAQAVLELSPGFNFFWGKNGSGKTSVLEALCLLGRGKSFRSSSFAPIIMNEKNKCTVRGLTFTGGEALLPKAWLAFERDRHGRSRYKVAGEEQKSAALAAQKLPLQVVDTQTSALIEGAELERRKFLDWGAFHSDYNFLEAWRGMNRALTQRNVALKQCKQTKKGFIDSWRQTFCFYAEQVHQARKKYFSEFCPVFLSMLEEYVGITELEVGYYAGWDQDMEGGLQDSLGCRLQHDIMRGFTSLGPQRGGLKILFEKKIAKEVLSRGQIKLISVLMLLTRAKMLSGKETNNKQKGIFLLDDLRAELDMGACQKVMAGIQGLGCQALVTVVDWEKGFPEILLPERAHGSKVFHVEHGVLRETG